MIRFGPGALHSKGSCVFSSFDKIQMQFLLGGSSPMEVYHRNLIDLIFFKL